MGEPRDGAALPDAGPCVRPDTRAMSWLVGLFLLAYGLAGRGEEYSAGIFNAQGGRRLR